MQLDLQRPAGFLRRMRTSFFVPHNARSCRVDSLYLSISLAAGVLWLAMSLV